MLERAKLSVELLTPVLIICVVSVAFMNHARIANALGGFLKDHHIKIEQVEGLGVTAKFEQQNDVARDLSSGLSEIIQMQSKALNLLRCERERTCSAAQDASITEILAKPATPPGVKAALNRSAPATDGLQQTEETVSIKVGVTIRARAGSKVVVGPNGAPATRVSTVDLVLLRALVRAERWKRALLSGEAATLEELAQGEGLQRSYARRMMRLAFLSPDLKAAIVAGRAPAGLTLQRLMVEGVARSWTDQARAAYT